MKLNLIEAICIGNIDEARKLIAQGADVNEANPHGEKPIEFAISYSNTRARAEINSATTEEAKQVLIAQLQNLSLEMVKLLLENGAEIEIVQSKNLQSTILHEALIVFF